MIGPFILLVAGGVAGGLTGAWPGVAAGMGAAVLVTFGVAAAAAWWPAQVGRQLDRETAWSVAPRPPGFGPLCDAVYRRGLGEAPEAPDGEEP